jgi:hypothetical protein
MATNAHDDDSDNELSSVMDDESLRALENTVEVALQEKAATAATNAHQDDSVSNLPSVMDKELLRTLDNELGAALQMKAATTTVTTAHDDSDLSSVMDEEPLRILKNEVGAALQNTATTTTVSTAPDSEGDSDLSSVLDEEALRTLEKQVGAAYQKKATAHDDDDSDSDLSSVMDDEPLRTLEDNVGAASWTKAAVRRSALRKQGQAARAGLGRVRFTRSTTAAHDDDDDSDSDLSSVLDDESFRGLEYVVAASRWKSVAAIGPSVLRKPGQAARVAGAQVTWATPLVAGAAANPFSRAELGIRRKRSVAAGREAKARQRDYLRKLRAEEEEAAVMFEDW